MTDDRPQLAPKEISRLRTVADELTEVAARQQEHWKEVKARDYPAMGVPHYLVVDPRKGVGTVYSDPSQGPDGMRYRKAVPFAFGDLIAVGPWSVDTSGLRTYED